jgi:putative ABC transport system permease protein
MLAPELAAGRGLAAGDVDAILPNAALAAKWPAMGWRVGNTVSFDMGPARTTWKVVGIVTEPFSPPTAYVPLAFFEAHGHTGVTNTARFALVKTDAASANRVRADLDRNLEREGIRALGSATSAESRFAFDQHMLMISVFLVVVSVLIGGVGALALATTVSLNVLERRRELGVLRAVGATPGAVWSIVVAEACAVALIAWAAAGILAWPVGAAVGSAIVRLVFPGGLVPSYELAGLAVWLGVSLALAVVASAIPAWRASRGPVREALEYE